MQVLGGKLQTVFCSPFRDEVKIIILCRLEAGKQLACGLAHKVFKQSGLIRVVAVEGPLREARLRDDFIQRCVLKTFFQKFFFPNFEDSPLGFRSFHFLRLPIYQQYIPLVYYNRVDLVCQWE